MSRIMHHYTSEVGYRGILQSKNIRPSLKANNPKDARSVKVSMSVTYFRAQKGRHNCLCSSLVFPGQGNDFLII